MESRAAQDLEALGVRRRRQLQRERAWRLTASCVQKGRKPDKDFASVVRVVAELSWVVVVDISPDAHRAIFCA